MQSDNAQARKLPVSCECNSSSQLSALSFAETLTIVGAASKAVHGINPFPQLSSIQAKMCGACEGEGFINVANGPDDSDRERCEKCNGTGRVVANN